MLTEENARSLRQVADELGVEIATLGAGYAGRMVWSLTEWPSTIGLAPAGMRAKRLQALKRASDPARWAGIPSITTHVGFMPRNPADALYAGLMRCARSPATAAPAGNSFALRTARRLL